MTKSQCQMPKEARIPESEPPATLQTPPRSVAADVSRLKLPLPPPRLRELPGQEVIRLTPDATSIPGC